MFVQLVIAAISTLPCPISPAPLVVAVATALGVGRLFAISNSVCGLVFRFCATLCATGSWLPPPTATPDPAEAVKRWKTHDIAVEHRIGTLDLGEASVAIAAAHPHRAEAFEAARYIIEELKRRLPIWKREHYVDGRSEWVSADGQKTADIGQRTSDVGGKS